MSNIREVINKKGKSYKATVRVKGYKDKYRTFTKKSLAKKWADEIEVQMRNGTYKENKVKSITGEAVFDTISNLIKYFKEHEAADRYSYAEKYDVMYDWWDSKIGYLKPHELNQTILSECKVLLGTEEIEKPLRGNKYRSNSTINKYLFAFSAVINYGIEEFALWEYNPMHRIGKKKKKKAVKLRVRFLSEDEIKKLRNGCREKSYMLCLFYLLALVTGGRYSEVQNLKPENIDFKNCRVHYLNTKNETNRGVPVPKILLIKIKTFLKSRECFAYIVWLLTLKRLTGETVILSELYLNEFLKRLRNEYLFMNFATNKLYYIKGQLEQVIKELEIEDFRIHDIRHTSASYFLMNGASETELMELFGWNSHAMVRRYAHLSKKHTENLVTKTSAVFL